MIECPTLGKSHSTFVHQDVHFEWMKAVADEKFDDVGWRRAGGDEAYQLGAVIHAIIVAGKSSSERFHLSEIVSPSYSVGRLAAKAKLNHGLSSVMNVPLLMALHVDSASVMQLPASRDYLQSVQKNKMEFEMSMKKVGVAAIATLAILGASLTASVPASARGMGGGGGFHGGGGGRGFGGGGFGGRGFGIGAGVATGLALGYGYGGYGYGYGYPAYAYNGYGGDCWIQHRVVHRYGHRVLVPVRVCG